MIIASIDIGTNTVLLLIAKVDEPEAQMLTPLKNEYRMPRIGFGVKKSGYIKNDRIDLLLEVLEDYSQIIKSYNCDKVIVTGTNALRISSNADEIIKSIKQKYGYTLNVITGEEEAEYAYLGAISGTKNQKNSLVIDIGGSSTEFILGKNQEIISKKSLQLGSVSLTEQFVRHSPPLNSELENLKSEIRKLVSSIHIARDLKSAIAIAGTATTLSCMINEIREFDESKVDNTSIEFNELNKLIGRLKSYSNADILEKFGTVMKGREDIILAGAYVLQITMDKINLKNVDVSTRGIRYGAIIKYLQSYFK